MPHEVSQETQRLDVTYSVLCALTQHAITVHDTDFHVLMAARIIVSDQLLASQQRDREELGPAAG